MLEFVVFAVTIVVFLIVAVLYLLPGSKQKISTVPGPEPVDYLEGNFPDIQASGSLHEYLVELHEIYGPIASLWWGPRYAVSIASPKLFKQNAKVFDRPPSLFELFKPLIGEDSIQYANGAEGRKRHTAYTKCYGPDVMHQYYKTFNKLSLELVTKLQSMAKDDHIPLRQYMMAFAIKAMLQGSMGTFFNDDKIVHGIRQAYDYLWSDMENRLKTSMPDPSQERLTRFDNQKEFMETTIRRALDHRRNNPAPTGEYLVIDAVLEVNEGDPSTIMSDMISVLIAGFHTSALLTTWALYFIASHPDVQERVYEELTMVLGDNELDPEKYADLKYVQQVLDETLRCSVLAPYAARVQDFDGELGGHKIPAGTPVIQALGVVLQDPEIYPDPEKFDPDRFSDEQKKGRPGFAFEPFGFAGKRKCLGYRFSLVEAAVLLAAVIRKFKVTLVEGQVVVPEYGLVTKPKEEIWITVSKRTK